jgi:hypothetical protein
MRKSPCINVIIGIKDIKDIKNMYWKLHRDLDNLNYSN